MALILDTTFDSLHPGSIAMYREKIGFFPWQWSNTREVIIYDDYVEVSTDNAGFAVGRVKNFTLFNPLALILHGVLDVIPSRLGQKEFLNKSTETLSFEQFKEKYPDLHKEIERIKEKGN